MIRRQLRSTLFPYTTSSDLFWAVTEAALRYALRRLGLTASEAQVRRLMDAYLSLACFPDVRPALERRSEEHTSELQSHSDLVCRLLLEKKNYYILSFV